MSRRELVKSKVEEIHELLDYVVARMEALDELAPERDDFLGSLNRVSRLSSEITSIVLDLTSAYPGPVASPETQEKFWAQKEKEWADDENGGE